MDRNCYQVWTYLSDMHADVIDISQHKKIYEGSAAEAETRINELRKKDFYKFIECKKWPKYTVEFYVREVREPTYIVYIVSDSSRKIYDICFNAQRAVQTQEMLERQLEKLRSVSSFGHKKIIIEERDDCDIRGENECSEPEDAELFGELNQFIEFLQLMSNN